MKIEDNTLVGLGWNFTKLTINKTTNLVEIELVSDSNDQKNTIIMPDSTFNRIIGQYYTQKSNNVYCDNDNWLPANGGSETPFKTRSGKTLLYVWQPKTGNHAYLDCDNDIILSDEEAQSALNL